MEGRTIHARCHCGHADFTIPMKSDQLPLQSSFCSCNHCRFATGQLAASFGGVPIHKDALGLDVSKLSKYDTTDVRTRHFCPRCGANVVDISDNLWRFCTGTLDSTEDLLSRNLVFVDDAGDGGITVWLKDIIGPAFRAGGESDEIDLGEFKKLPSSSRPHPDDRLQAQCHCGGVQFQILPPPNGEKFKAGIDICTSCRLTTGFELSTWTSVPLNMVQMEDGRPFNFDAGTLERYESSPGTQRQFCGRCGATVCLSREEQEWIDIAAGLLRAEEGARCEKWLEWKELGYREEATDRRLVEDLSKAIQQWSMG